MSTQRKVEYTHTCDLCQDSVESNNSHPPSTWTQMDLTPNSDETSDLCPVCAGVIKAAIESRRKVARDA